MRIIFFTDHFYPEVSAPAGHIFDRCKIWAQQGHDVVVVTNIPNYPSGNPYSGYKNTFRSWETIEGINILRVGTFMAGNSGTLKRTLDYISFTISSLINSMSIPKPDIVFSTTPHIFIPLGAIVYCFFKRVPHVLEVRDLWPESIVANTGMIRNSRIYKILEWLEEFIYRYSKNIIVFTESFKSNISQRGIDSNKLHVVINGANLEIFSNLKYNEELADSIGMRDKFVVSYIGTFGLSHNLSNAIRAASILKEKDIHFLMLGEGAEKNIIQSLARELGADNVHFVDRKPRSELPKYWSLSNIGLVHLKNDPVFSSVIPSKIFETMAVGVPIVYSGPKSEGSQIIKKYNCGLIAQPDSPQDLANKILSLKENNDLLERLAINGKSASQIFSREAQAESTLEVLKISTNQKK